MEAFIKIPKDSERHPYLVITIFTDEVNNEKKEFIFSLRKSESESDTYFRGHTTMRRHRFQKDLA